MTQLLGTELDRDGGYQHIWWALRCEEPFPPTACQSTPWPDLQIDFGLR